MMDAILLVDMGSIFWPHWMATKSQVHAFYSTIERIERCARDYECVIVCVDSPRNWRHDLTESLPKEAQYKANRPRQPEEATLALRDTQGRLRKLGYHVVGVDNYEADDVIATLCDQAFLDPVHILSEDKDLFQLLGPTVTQLTKGGEITPAGCERKFGLPPRLIRDLLAIWGDASDGVAGCYGVGQGKAVDLLKAFGSIEGIKAASVEQLRAIRGIGPKVAESIREWDPTLAVQLVSLKRDVPINLEQLRRKEEAA